MSAQDMPPPGGFGSINIGRIEPRVFMRQSLWWAVLFAASYNGMFVIREWKQRQRVIKIEQAEHFIAASPFVIAEQERAFLRALRIARDEERELTKDIPGWEVGTFYGQPIYMTQPPDTLPPACVLYLKNQRSVDEWMLKTKNPDIWE